MEMDERKLYVANLPLDVTEEELQNVFRVYGSLEEVHINAPKEQRPARSAFVRFEEAEEAAAAMVVLNDMYKFREEGWAVSVSLARPSGSVGCGKAAGGKGAGPLAAPPALPAPPPAGSLQTPPPPAPAGGGGQWSGGGCGAQANGRWDGEGQVPDYGGGGGQWQGGAYGSGAGGQAWRNHHPLGNYDASPAYSGSQPGTGRPERRLDPAAKLWVGNLPGDITEQTLEKVFSAYGQVEDVLILPSKSRSGQLCAFLHYATPQQADSAIAAMSAGYELRPGEGELKVERPGAPRNKGCGGAGNWIDGGKGKAHHYQPY